MEKPIEYASFIKLLIFGPKGSGKTSLAKTFDENNIDNNSEEIKPSKNSKKIK